jgi:hypothetical protein
MRTADPKLMQTLRTVWIALAGFDVAILAVLLLFPISMGGGEAESLGTIFPVLLGLLSIVEAIVVVALLRSRVLLPVQTGVLDLGKERDAQQLFQALIVVWAIANSVGMYGLLVGAFGYEQILGVPFAVSSLILLYMARPWQSALQPPASVLGRTGPPLA